MRRSRCLLGMLVVALSLLAAAPARAVVLYRTATRNTVAPTGWFYGSGFQWTGNWGSFVGTPIAKNYFITASHVGGGVGQPLVLNGKSYYTTAMYDDPVTDLRIFKTSAAFPSFAPIYTGTGEVGKTSITFGRGTQRGAAVVKNGVTKGWKWGTSDLVHSWGTNIATGFQNFGVGNGDLIKYAFNHSGTAYNNYNEAALTGFDSGGGVFVNDNGTWKLAGVNYLIDGPFSLTGGTDPGFQAAIFDKGGIYQKNGSSWAFNFDTTADIPANWYATRISERAAWIKSVIGGTSSPTFSISSAASAVPEPASISALLLIGSSLVLRRRRI